MSALKAVHSMYLHSFSGLDQVLHFRHVFLFFCALSLSLKRQESAEIFTGILETAGMGTSAVSRKAGLGQSW